jgi:TonB family protein
MDTSSEIKSKYFALVFTIGVHAILFILFLLVEFISPGQLLVSKVSAEPSDFIGFDLNKSYEEMSSPEIRSSSHPLSAKISQNKNDITSRVTDRDETDLNAKSHSDFQEKDLQNALIKLRKIKNVKGNKNDNAVDSEIKSIGTEIGKSVIPGNSSAKIDLYGRELIKRPEALTDSKEEGVVVVEIIVDENGNVIKATPGQRGSSITSTGLFEKAKQKAIQAKFNPSSEGIKEQRGTYTFIFSLQ